VNDAQWRACSLNTQLVVMLSTFLPLSQTPKKHTFNCTVLLFTSINPKMAGSAQERYDNVLFSLAQEHPGGALEFLDTILSFFARKTDFFVGGEEGAAKRILLEKFDKWSSESFKIKEAEIRERAENEKRRQERIAAKKKQEDELIKKMTDEPAISEITEEEANQLEEENERKKKKQGLMSGVNMLVIITLFITLLFRNSIRCFK